jgi:branched-chain amino acid transport system substrate-binding protein
MIKLNKQIAMLCGITTFICSLAGCGAADTATSVVSGSNTVTTEAGQRVSEGSEKNKLAFFLPLTGDLMQYGLSLQKGAELALKQYNEKNGTNYIVEFNDDKGDPTESVNVANKIVSDPTVIAGLGSFNSSCAMAAAPVFEENKMLLLSPTASHTDFPTMGDYIFASVISQKYEGAMYADELKKQDVGTKVAIIYQNTDFGVQATELFANRWKEIGGTIVANEAFVPGSTKDFSPVISKIKQQEPEILYISASYSDAAQIFIQAKNLDLNTTFVGPATCLNEEFLELVGTQVDGSIMLSTNPCFMPSVLETADLDENTKAFVNTYEEAYNEIPDGFAAQAFDAVNILLESVEKVGTDSSALRDEIASLRGFEGVSGYDMQFNDNKEMVKGVYVFEVKDGNFYRVN